MLVPWLLVYNVKLVVEIMLFLFKLISSFVLACVALMTIIKTTACHQVKHVDS